MCPPHTLYLLMFMIWAVRSLISMIFSILILDSFSALREGKPGANHGSLKVNQKWMELWPEPWAQASWVASRVAGVMTMG